MNKRILSLIIFISLLFQYIPVAAQTNTDWLEIYRQPGETVITLAQGLKYNGQVYQIHYFTTGNLSINDSYFIARASPEFFKKEHVAALLISSNGEVITDEDVIEQVLLRYRAAHYLYIEQNEPLFYDPAGLAEDMHKFTKSPLLIQYWERIIKNSLFNSKEEEYAEAMRGILSTQLELPGTLQTFVEATSKYGKTVETFGEAAEKAITTFKLDRSLRVRQASNYLETTTIFKSWKKTGAIVSISGHQIELTNALDLFAFATKLIWVEDLQKNRLQMLEAFVMDTEGETNFDKDMLSAYSETSLEVDDAWSQRGQIIRAFVEEHSLELAEKLSSLAFEKLLYKYAFDLAEKRISVYAITHSISLVSLGYLAGDALFGIDDTYNNFLIGLRTDELRQKFQSWRQFLIKNTRNQSFLVFDGELAAKYRSAYLLEAYASARVYRLYADGVAASARTGIIDLIKRLGGQEYAEAGDDLRKIGIQIESDAEETLGYPSFLEEAQRLSHNRLMLVSLTVDDSSSNFSKEGKSVFWNTVPTGYAGNAMWTYNESESPINSGTWKLTLKDSGNYLVQVYIPMPTKELEKPYSASVTYLVTHAQGIVEVVIDQAKRNGGWVDLGVFEFEENQKAIVSLNDQTGELQGDTLVVFDAVRFIPETQMAELLEGEPFNFGHVIQEYEEQVKSWWEEVTNESQQTISQWWEEQQQKIKDLFEQWWRELWKKIEDELNQWLEELLTEILNQCIPNVLLPVGVAAGVWMSRRRQKR